MVDLGALPLREGKLRAAETARERTRLMEMLQCLRVKYGAPPAPPPESAAPPPPPPPPPAPPKNPAPDQRDPGRVAIKREHEW